VEHDSSSVTQADESRTVLTPTALSFVKRTDAAARVEAGAFAALSTAITVWAGTTEITAVLGVIVFVVLGAVPYVAACAISAVRPYRRCFVYSSRVALLSYGVLDVTTRYRALVHPASSTDAIVAVALPLIWSPIVMLTSALLMLVVLATLSAAARRNLFD
jgi:hypothetical protein